MAGDAVQPENLVEAQPEHILQGRFLGATRSFTGDQPVKGGAPPDYAKGKFLAEMTIGGGQLGAGQRGIQEGFDEFPAARMLPQELCRNLSWFLSVQCV